MATIRKIVNAYGVAKRKSEREQLRRAKEASKNFKNQEKATEIINAKEAVKQYNEYIDTLTSLHKYPSYDINWNDLKNTPKPSSPSPVIYRTLKAENEISEFTPTFFAKLFKTVEKQKSKLNANLYHAQVEDAKETSLLNEEFEEDLNDWEQLQSIADKVLANQPLGYKLALEYFSPFSDLAVIGSAISLEFKKDYVIANINIRSEDILPKYTLSLSQSGKLSKKAISNSKFNEIYQDYVCSASLRVSRDLLSSLPIKFAIINAVSELLDTKTGFLAEKIILSVLVQRDTLTKLNLVKIDPSDSMKNFLHNMKFSKLNGFSVVSQVDFLTNEQ